MGQLRFVPWCSMALNSTSDMKCGDKVSAQSNEFYMIVRHVEGNAVTCGWFDFDNIFHERTYDISELTLHQS